MNWFIETFNKDYYKDGGGFEACIAYWATMFAVYFIVGIMKVLAGKGWPHAIWIFSGFFSIVPFIMAGGPGQLIMQCTTGKEYELMRFLTFCYFFAVDVIIPIWVIRDPDSFIACCLVLQLWLKQDHDVTKNFKPH